MFSSVVCPVIRCFSTSQKGMVFWWGRGGGERERSYWTQNVFWFSLQVLSETFLIPRRTEPVVLDRSEWNLNFIYRYLKKISQYQISWKSVQWEPCFWLLSDRRKPRIWHMAMQENYKPNYIRNYRPREVGWFMAFSFITFLHFLLFLFYHCVYICVFCILLFNSVVRYVFLLLCTFCSVYSVFIAPNDTLRLPWQSFSLAFSSVVTQMPG